MKLTDFSPTHRHLKTGHLYEVVFETAWDERTFGKSNAERRVFTVYRDNGGNVWARDKTEFEDGRFAALASAEGKK